ncbi:MAG: thiol reductant ABC exporter subunit CydD [Oceanospirillaceae bacterium]
MNKPVDKEELTATKEWLKLQKPLAGNSLTISIVLSIGAGILLIAQSAVLAIIVNQLVFLDKHWQELQSLLLVLIALMLSRILLVKYTEKQAFNGAKKIKLQLREALYEKLESLGPAYIEQQHSAELAELLQQGVEALEAYYAKYLPAVAFCAIIPLSILAVVLPVDWLTAIIFLVTAPLIPLFMILIGLKAEKLNQQHWQQLSRMSNHFLDVLQGMSHLKLFNASRAEAASIAKIADNYRRSTMSILKIAFLSSFALEFLATLSVAMVAVTVGFRLFWGELDFAIGFMLLLLAPEFYIPFRNLGTQYHAKMKGVAAAQKMLLILNEQPSHLGTTPFKQNLSSSRNKSNDKTKQTTAQFNIEYHNVSFEYPNQRPALSNVSLQINEPGMYAIVGPSGAGKSTLIDLLLGFLTPLSGEISINQQNLAHMERNSWQQYLAWVPQNPQLIFGSLLQNIQLANPNASVEQVKQAAHLAGVDQFVDQFKLGWEHPISEQGVGVSGGQKQRIAMARVFLKDAPILILDEPSAHLDEATEQWLQQTLKHYAKDHYIFIVAHRLHSITACKTIFVLDKGNIVEQGSHATLMNSSALYQQLFSANQHE